MNHLGFSICVSILLLGSGCKSKQHAAPEKGKQAAVVAPAPAPASIGPPVTTAPAAKEKPPEAPNTVADLGSPDDSGSDAEEVEPESYDSIEAMCPWLKKTESRLDFDFDSPAEGPPPHYTFEFTCNERELKRMSDGLPPPLAEVVFFVSSAFAVDHPVPNHSSGSHSTQVTLNVAARIGTKWYLISTVERGLAVGDGIKLLEAAVKPVGPAAAKLLVARLQVDTSESSMFQSSHESITVIGVGPSGRPSAISAVKIVDRDGTYPYREDSAPTEKETRRDFRFEKGELVLYRKTEIPNVLAKTKQKKVTNVNERTALTFP